MKHLKTYESFEYNSYLISVRFKNSEKLFEFSNEFLLDIKDILVELEDDDFRADYHFDTKFKIMHIFINKPGYLFKMNDNLIYVLKRMSRFFRKTHTWFLEIRYRGKKLYIHDELGIKTRVNFFKKWIKNGQYQQ